MAKEPSNEALRLWIGLPADTRQIFLNSVWCGECREAVTIVDYHAELRRVVVLQGFCGTCGHRVVRVIDGLAPAPTKNLRAPASGLCIFDVWLLGDAKLTLKNRIIRKIQIAGTKSLYQFAKVITQAFDFDLDHCFAFYERLDGHFFAGKAFELFVDIGEEPTVTGAKGVKKVKIRQAFKSLGEKMIFLFDYGDGWQFNVELKEIREGNKGSAEAIVLESIGKAPLQYPPCEEKESQ